MRNSLYPCPFCGSLNLDIFISFADEQIKDAKTGQNYFNVQCNSCGAQGSSAVGEAQARLRWNRRAGSVAKSSEMLEIIKKIATCDNFPQYKQCRNEARSFLTKLNKESKI